MVSVLVCVSCVCSGGVVCHPCVLVCVCVCVLVWCVAVGFPGWGLLFVWVSVWLVCVVVGPSPLVAEVPKCDCPPLLAGFRCRWWWVLLATPGRGPRVRIPATPGWGPLAAVVCGPLPLLAAGPGCGSRHSWLGGPLVVVVGGPLRLLAEGFGCCSSPLLAGVVRPRRLVFPWVGVSRVVCACGAACVRGVCAGVCGVCSWCLCWWWCGCGCAFRVKEGPYQDRPLLCPFRL